MAMRHGMRIIGPLRPGFGQTTVYPGEASEPGDFVTDVRALLDHLGIDKVAIVSFSSGLVHALAAAAQMPESITGITACHPLLPVLSDEDLEGTNGYNDLLPHARLVFSRLGHVSLQSGHLARKAQVCGFWPRRKVSMVRERQKLRCSKPQS